MLTPRLCPVSKHQIQRTSGRAQVITGTQLRTRTLKSLFNNLRKIKIKLRERVEDDGK
jgi:hypothetical protein